ncbi:bifunctional molybdenum cofactor guanylyltransferase MobA/molybdopterin-guanine dinucleotide biosynthesis adaptor protein MobB [Selenomonas sp. TAMA-11512]|uniref:molybdopterin-guanine dinucleotide biosynthesis protein B n=1 Tax=Selenomonas sp. TAMA-11512 TaxID=3095337 RepID=UPI00308D6F24|nr:bifunctional molybdenum cofactor guanylyltransferase MobA/molybdopterin-guanine dinucleotide biosynthesis adaptor protein MobB [Selenomonas sp. TAMA-11512]
MKISDISCLIVAGGQSTRMGYDKRTIELSGETLLEGILRKASRQGFRSVILSVDRSFAGISNLAEKYNAHVVFDREPGRGPMEGLALGLSASNTDWVLVLSTDMPFYTFSLLSPLITALEMAWKRDRHPLAVISCAAGRRQPLASLYHRSLGVAFHTAIARRMLKLGEVIEAASTSALYVDIQGKDTRFFNINTPADLRLAIGRAINLSRKVPLVTITAPKSNTGKTTFIERILPRLAEMGIYAGVVKSDAHAFTLDTEGKDTDRFFKAGAHAVALTSKDGYFLFQRTDEQKTLLELAEKLENVDLILFESRAHGIFPAIGLFRGLGEPHFPNDVVAVFSDRDIAVPQPVHHIDDIDRATFLVLFLTGL